MSPQQRQLWRRQRADGPSAYRAQALLAVEGEVRAEGLKRAVEQVISRHDILRTGFQRTEGGQAPTQILEEDARLHWGTIDLRGAGAREQAEALEQLWDAEARREQMPEQSGALRATLALLSDTRGRLLLSVPPLCADARTLRNLAWEISRAYGAAPPDEGTSGEPLQYADLSQWQNELFDSDEAEVGKDYWRGRYAEGWLAPALPFGRRPPGAEPFDPQALSVDLNPRLWDRLKALPLYQSSPAVFLLSCWQVLLWRLGARPEEVSVAVAHDGRAYEELRDALGLLAKSLPVSARLLPDELFKEVVERAAQSVRETARWQEYFSWEYLGAAEDAGPQFLPYGFDYEERASAAWQTPVVTFRVERVWVCHDRYAVKLNCVQKDGSLTTEWHYDAGSSGAEEVRRLARRYHKLLESITERPQATVGELTVLDDDERRRQLYEWNATAADYPRGLLLHELFERQVQRTPARVALVFADERLSYAELDERAEVLAGRLRGLGVGPEAAVGVLMERGVGMVVALLGVLKAGGAYVPLDPEYPGERIEFMLADSGAGVLLTQEHLTGRLPEYGGRVVRLGAGGEVEGPEGEAGALGEGKVPAIAAENLAYVIYTSGSTGRPKGAMNTHAAIVNRLLWMQDEYGLDGSDVVLQKTPFGFDVSVWEFFWPLLAGARLVLARPGGHRDPAYLRALIEGERVTVLHFVPSMLGAFLGEGGGAGCGGLRRVICSGEALGYGLQERCHAAVGAELHNLYGPTEAAVDVTSWDCERGGARREVPIGKPISNTQISSWMGGWSRWGQG